MPAYWIAHVEVSDAERYGEYARRAGPAIASFGGKGGGGRPDMAQAGGADPKKAPEAIAAARALLEA